MLQKSKSIDSHSSGYKKKKPAPPRPPQPRLDQVNENSTNGKGSTSLYDSRPPMVSTDLIDLYPSSNRRVSAPTGSTIAKEREYFYRVGASIFYVKSGLKNSTSETPQVNPFSPPRPSAESLLSTPTHSKQTSSNNNKNAPSSKVTNHPVKYFSKPTIIRAGGTLPDSNDSNTTTSSNQQQFRYSNLGWDQPAESQPVVVRPLDSYTDAQSYSNNQKRISQEIAASSSNSNYYDVPPEEDDILSMENVASPLSPPMPDMTPPPPPKDVRYEEDKRNSSSSDKLQANENDGIKAYAIALYDFMPEAEGDLMFQAGDVIDLIMEVDESWMYGQCGGSEGLFPANHVNVVVPLSNQVQSATSETNRISQEESTTQGCEALVLYDFQAETETDLSLKAGDMVKISGRINDDWLYGESNGTSGQFPAVFIDNDQIPENLPYITL